MRLADAYGEGLANSGAGHFEDPSEEPESGGVMFNHSRAENLVLGLISAGIFAYLLDPIVRGMWQVILLLPSFVTNRFFRFAAAKSESIGLLIGAVTLLSVGMVFVMHLGARVHGRLLPSLVITAVALVFYLAGTVGFAAILRMSFDDRMSRLAPFLSEEQEEALAARWASMANVDDFNLVATQLSELAHENDPDMKPLRLPFALF